ncbi:hypothetical protein CLOP_g17428 [Closterium sp. NIES-67]|nr:hypothetical protein CLOP_g17428 [Closterium sp. NIES-67]
MRGRRRRWQLLAVLEQWRHCSLVATYVPTPAAAGNAPAADARGGTGAMIHAGGDTPLAAGAGRQPGVGLRVSRQLALNASPQPIRGYSPRRPSSRGAGQNAHAAPAESGAAAPAAPAGGAGASHGEEDVAGEAADAPRRASQAHDRPPGRAREFSPRASAERTADSAIARASARGSAGGLTRGQGAHAPNHGSTWLEDSPDLGGAHSLQSSPNRQSAHERAGPARTPMAGPSGDDAPRSAPPTTRHEQRKASRVAPRGERGGGRRGHAGRATTGRGRGQSRRGDLSCDGGPLNGFQQAATRALRALGLQGTTGEEERADGTYVPG